MKIKIVIMSLILLLVVGCESSEYKNALKLYNNGEYLEASKIFSKLDNYKDSQELLKNSKWKGLCKYLATPKEVMGEDSWVFSMTAKDNQIIYDADLDLGINKMHYKVTFSQNSENAKIEGIMNINLGIAWSNNKAEGTWNIEDYKSGEIKFDTSSAEGKTATGEKVTESALTEINPNQAKSFIIEGIKKIIEQYDSEYKLKDLGFLAIEN